MQKSSSYFQRVPKHILVEAIKLAYLIFTFINSWTIFFVIQSINRLVTLTKKKKLSHQSKQKYTIMVQVINKQSFDGINLYHKA